MSQEKILKVDLNGGPGDSALFADSDLPMPSLDEEEENLGPGIALEKGNALWYYKHEGRISGVPVADTDKDLLIGTDDLLSRAFELRSNPKSWMKWMAPEYPEAMAEYDALLVRNGSGEIRIVDERVQYDADKKAYLTWVRYEELEYRLAKRYECIRGKENE